jgi:hypothetical protein
MENEGELQKENCHFQGVSWTTNAEITLPPAAPIGVIAPNNPIAIFLSLPGGKVCPISATAFGTTKAAPIPVRPRKRETVTIDFGEAGDEREDRPRQSSHKENVLCPNTSPNRPPMRTKAPCVIL